MTDASSLLVKSRRVATPEGIRPAAVRIVGGRIAAVDPYDAAPGGLRVDDAGELAVFPGLVDTHVHANDPGRAHWEGFSSATAAAASGGITTILDMPLNSIPPTTTLSAFRAKLEAAAGRCSVDVGFWGGLLADNRAELGPLRRAGAFGFKCFLAPSGVAEFPEVGGENLLAGVREIARIGAVLLVHAEEPARIAESWNGSPASYAAYLATRPAEAEREAVVSMIDLCRRTGARVHIVHLSAADALEPLADAKRDGLPITAETCPHYLFFSAEEVPDGATLFKCAPPIRGAKNRERLWRGLADGVIDQIVSDHSPAPPDRKALDSGSFALAWGGIASLELTLAATWTAARARGVAMEKLAEWMSAAPARLAGLGFSKGAIAPGLDGDLVVWDPERSQVVDASRLLQRHKGTPYGGRELSGVVISTYLRGEKIFGRGRVAGARRGELLLSGDAPGEPRSGGERTE